MLKKWDSTAESAVVASKPRAVRGVAKMLLAAGLSATLIAGLTGCVVGDSGTSESPTTQKAQAEQNAQGAEEAGATQEELDLSFSKRDLDYTYDESTATKVRLADGAIGIDGEGATADGSTLTLSAAGTYMLSGSLGNGSIVVSAGDEDKLQVVFDGVSVSNDSGPAMYVENADKVFVTLAEGTQNALSDGTNYALDGADDNRDATLFSKDDLAINGIGELSIKGNYQHAVVSKDDLVIAGPTLEVTSKEDGFQGNDCVKIAEGSITVNAGDDAIKSDSFVYVKDGTIDVQTCYEGYEAEQIIIDGGTHTIMASDDALNAALASDGSAADGTAPSGNGFGMAPSGNQSPTPSGNVPAQPDASSTAASFAQQDSADIGSEISQRGNGFRGGKGTGSQDSGNGMQGQGGKMGGFGGGNMGGMPQSSGSCYVQINGGTLTLSGGADAIDSNGNVEINGGLVMVCGPNSGMDGSLDYDLSAQINGGTVLMTGSVGSTNGLSQSDQAWMLASIQGAKGNVVALLDGNGNVLASLTATQPFANVLVSSSQITSGSAFTVSVNGNATPLTMN